MKGPIGADDILAPVWERLSSLPDGYLTNDDCEKRQALAVEIAGICEGAIAKFTSSWGG